MGLYLTILLFCCVATPRLIAGEDAHELTKKIKEYHEQASILDRENAELTQKFNSVKQQCEAEKRPLEKLQSEISAKHQASLAQLQKLNNALTEKELEEKMLISALNREYNIHNKYSLKIELYNQELELYNSRKQEGVAQKCHLLQPLFKKYQTSIIALRSVKSVRRPSSKKDRIIVLQSDLNRVKLIVKKKQIQNEELKTEINDYVQRCAAEKEHLQSVIESSKEALQQQIANIDLLQIELDQTIEIVNKHKKHLSALKEENKRLKATSLEMKRAIESFERDLECYKNISDLNVSYK